MFGGTCRDHDSWRRRSCDWFKTPELKLSADESIDNGGSYFSHSHWKCIFSLRYIGSCLRVTRKQNIWWTAEIWGLYWTLSLEGKVRSSDQSRCSSVLEGAGWGGPGFWSGGLQDTSNRKEADPELGAWEHLGSPLKKAQKCCWVDEHLEYPSEWNTGWMDGLLLNFTGKQNKKSLHCKILQSVISYPIQPVDPKGISATRSLE